MDPEAVVEHDEVHTMQEGLEHVYNMLFLISDYKIMVINNELIKT